MYAMLTIDLGDTSFEQRENFETFLELLGWEKSPLKSTWSRFFAGNAVDEISLEIVKLHVSQAGLKAHVCNFETAVAFSSVKPIFWAGR